MTVKNCIKLGAKLYCYNKHDKTVSMYLEQKIDLKECPESVLSAIIDNDYDVKIAIKNEAGTLTSAEIDALVKG